MIRAARAELEALSSRGDRIGHKDFEVLYTGMMVMVACVSVGDQEATAIANVVKVSGGRWKIADSQSCDDHSTRRHLVFEFVQK